LIRFPNSFPYRFRYYWQPKTQQFFYLPLRAMRVWREYSYSTAQLCSRQQPFVKNCIIVIIIIIIIIIIIPLFLPLVSHTEGGTSAESAWD
jgi:hypothetical protein